MLAGLRLAGQHSLVPAFQFTRPRLATAAPRYLASVSQQPVASEGRTQDPYAYCKALVQKRDYEAYLMSHFYPSQLRNAFFALRAFYVSYPLHHCCVALIS